MKGRPLVMELLAAGSYALLTFRISQYINLIKEVLLIPVQRALKFSAVFGTLSLKS